MISDFRQIIHRNSDEHEEIAKGGKTSSSRTEVGYLLRVEQEMWQMDIDYIK